MPYRKRERERESFQREKTYYERFLIKIICDKSYSALAVF